MSFFQQLVSALDSPNQQGTSGQVASMMSTVQQLGDSYQTNPSTINSALSLVGGFVRSALQEKQATEGNAAAQQVVNQYSGTYPNPQAVNALFGSSQISQIVGTIASRTGLDANLIQQMLPILVPLVLNLLKTGASTQGPSGGNPVLTSFLDADGDGDVDVMDAMQLAARHMGR